MYSFQRARLERAVDAVLLALFVIVPVPVCGR